MPECHKEAYTSHEASQALRRCSSKKHKGRREKKKYKCDDCGWYRLTSQGKRDSK